MAQHLLKRGWKPERIISSDARRTTETCQLLCEIWEVQDVHFTQKFYLAGPREVQHALQEVSDSVRRLLILGHNNGWEEVVHWLSGEEVTLRTASAALLTTQESGWDEAVLGPGRWNLVDLVHPDEE
jgi:phosphohistidine phosphatase